MEKCHPKIKKKKEIYTLYIHPYTFKIHGHIYL